MRFLAILTAAAVLTGGAGPVLAQDAPDPSPGSEQSAEQEQEQEQERPVDVASETFRPSEEVKADTAVAFPTDI